MTKSSRRTRGTMARTRPRLSATARGYRRRQAKTVARGYGRPHQLARAAALAAFRPGQPCARCGEPITELWRVTRTGRVVTAIHLDHADSRAGYLPGALSHATCNESAGGVHSNLLRVAAGKRPWPATPARQAAPAPGMGRRW
jgi:hypothetical protein